MAWPRATRCISTGHDGLARVDKAESRPGAHELGALRDRDDALRKVIRLPPEQYRMSPPDTARPLHRESVGSQSLRSARARARGAHPQLCRALRRQRRLLPPPTRHFPRTSASSRLVPQTIQFRARPLYTKGWLVRSVPRFLSAASQITSQASVSGLVAFRQRVPGSTGSGCGCRGEGVTLKSAFCAAVASRSLRSVRTVFWQRGQPTQHQTLPSAAQRRQQKATMSSFMYTFSATPHSVS